MPIVVETEPAFGQPIETQTSFYYYMDGERAALTPSLEWISVRFASADVDTRESILLSYAEYLDELEETHDIPVPELTLLPLREGTSPQNLLDLVKAMRNDRKSFVIANPLFETDEVWMAFGDQFVAGFSMELTRAEIEAFNEQHDVEIMKEISGQENVFLLRTAPGSGLDALAAANLYQESGIALHAAPDFIRITKVSDHQ